MLHMILSYNSIMIACAMLPAALSLKTEFWNMLTHILIVFDST